MMDFYYRNGCGCSKASVCLLAMLGSERHEFSAAKCAPEVIGDANRKQRGIA